MATTVQIAAPHARSPTALWHLLSLDAPSVAALWVCLIARSQRIHLPAASPLAMALAVWTLYAADRLLDTRTLGTTNAGLEARHFFHHRHRRRFLTGIAAAAIALAALLPHLDSAALHLYLIEGAALLTWLLILHASRSAHRLPKEIAVGLFFSAAVFIPTIARQPILRASLLPPAVLFAALCSLNCLFIYRWEHAQPADFHTPHLSTRIAIQHLPALASTLLLAAILATLYSPDTTRTLFFACTLSFAALLALHATRHRLSRIHLRAAADLALLTPLLLLPFL